MTTAENLNRIIQAKSDIKTAIENKGVTVGNITIDGYADKINQITGGESSKIVLPNGICLSGSTWETFDATQYDWSKITNMKFMFMDCKQVTSIDLSNWDTSNVLDMSFMFSNCARLSEIKMGGDVSKVADVTGMFGMAGASASNCIFYYNPKYDYSKIIEVLTLNWTAVPME